MLHFGLFTHTMVIDTRTFVTSNECVLNPHPVELCKIIH